MIFPQFPKIRAPLPKQYSKTYESFCKSNHKAFYTTSKFVKSLL
ncbi:hypothetical protein [Helicobacter sp. T3_23-1056]